MSKSDLDDYCTKEYVTKIGNLKDDFESKWIYRYEWRRKKSVLSHLLNNTYDKILDVGCSNGSYFELLHEIGFNDIYGIDVSKDRVSIANKRGYLASNAKGQMLPFKNNAFNTVICLDVLVNIIKIKDYHEIIKEIYRILNHKGVFIFSFPNRKAFELVNKINRITGKRPLELTDYSTVYELSKVKKFLKSLNFDILKIKPILFIYPERIARIPPLIGINDLLFGDILKLEDYGKITYLKVMKL